jgi:hypothetical protein
MSSSQESKKCNHEFWLYAEKPGCKYYKCWKCDTLATLHVGILRVGILPLCF